MSQNIELLDNRPWVPHHIPNAVRKELYRRTLDQGFNFVDVDTSWNNYKNYRGPLSAWTRVTSNGTGFRKTFNTNQGITKEEFEKNKREGFVMYGGQGFHNAFGNFNFENTNSPYESSILGYDTNNKPHILDLETNSNFNINLKNKKTQSVPIFLPCPGIVSVEANMQKERIRKVTIQWKCYSFAQLEYMTPYFLTPGISVIVELGWNLFNPESLLDLTNKKELTDLFRDGTPLYNRILKSNGMYDVTYGIITNFEFGSQDGMTYECKTEIFSKHRNHTGALLNEAPQSTTELNQDGSIKTITTKPSLAEFCKQRLKNVTKCLEGDGKNFFENLTVEDEGKIGYDNTKLQKLFFNGKKENRIFIARGKIKNDPATIAYEEPDKDIDWDSTSPDSIWVTMGFVVDLINLFIGQKITTIQATDDPSFDLFTIDINDVAIGGHPNLISCDGDKVLIPNSTAPKFNLGALFWKSDYKQEDWITNKLQSQTSYKSAASFEQAKPSGMLPYNSRLYHVFKTGYGISDTLPSTANTLGAYRDNLDFFINRFRYNFGSDPNGKVESSQLEPYEAAFPQPIDYTEKGNEKKAGYWGYLKDIFVNVDVIISAAEKSKTAEEFLSIILNELSGATAGFWELAIVEDEKKLRIIDKKFINKKVYQNLYQFDIASDTNIKGLTFTVTPSNVQMTQVIAGSNNNQGGKTGQTTATALPEFYFGDRLGLNQLEPEKQKSFINESSDIIKQLQKYGKTPGAYFTSLKILEDNKQSSKSPNVLYYEVINLALPSKHLLLTILDCQDYEDNLNMYGGQQPNFTCELTLTGISGIRTFQCFSIKNLPKPYSPDDVIFSIIDLNNVIQNGEWNTVIKAGIRPKPKVVSPNINFEYSNGKEAYEATTDIKLENIK